MSGACTLAYSDEASSKASFMLGEISKALDGSGCDDVVTSATYAASFSGAGDQVQFIIFKSNH